MEKSQGYHDMNGKRVALIHDFLTCQGGAEKVLKVLSDVFPEAPIYTLLYDREKMRGMFEGKDIRTSFIQKFPRFLKKRYRWLLPFFPVAVEAFDLRDFDVVISSSGAWSKGIVTRLHTKHIAYIHSPMRYVWDYNERYLQEIGGGKISILKRILLSYMRMWDREAADRPDILIANSRYTQSRVQKYYRRESEVIYPPVVEDQREKNDTQSESSETFFGFKSKEYFLVVSRLTQSKKVDIAVDAFNKLGLSLIVVGEGVHEKHLKDIARENIQFAGFRSESDVDALYRNARGFIFPSEDDFGMVMVEAMLRGVPVIAYKHGGAAEIVEEGVTGEFFAVQAPEILADGVRRFLEKEREYDMDVIQESAKRFSKEKFIQAIQESVSKVVSDTM